MFGIIMTQLGIDDTLGIDPYDSPRLIIQGEKTQTRRAVKAGQEFKIIDGKKTVLNPSGSIKWQVDRTYAVVPKRSQPTVYYRVSDTSIELAHDSILSEYHEGYTYLDHAKYLGSQDPHRFMRWKDHLEVVGFKPLRIRITDIEKQRFRDVSYYDAIQEGVHSKRYSDSVAYWDYVNRKFFHRTSFVGAIASYDSLFEKINGKDAWESNPQVWKLTFEVAS